LLTAWVRSIIYYVLTIRSGVVEIKIMPISDKTRKLLWGRSGNRCAICKCELVIIATNLDDESIVGEECHIISSSTSGPRYDQSLPQEKLDAYENLILLCRTHHKMIDDQSESYSSDILRQMKMNHEVWVSEKLSASQNPKRVKIHRVKQNIPAYLVRLTTGREALNLVLHSYVMWTNHDELNTQEEVDLIGGFLQNLRDLADIGSELEPADEVQASFSLTKSLEELERAGYFVFGGREIQLIEGGNEEPSDWPVAFLSILRKNNGSIVTANPHEVGNLGV
jgi:hypothetical protein